MKKGDLVRWCSVQNDEQKEFDIDCGIVIETVATSSAPPTGMPTTNAAVLWPDCTISWMNVKFLEVVK